MSCLQGLKTSYWKLCITGPCQNSLVGGCCDAIKNLNSKWACCVNVDRHRHCTEGSIVDYEKNILMRFHQHDSCKLIDVTSETSFSQPDKDKCPVTWKWNHVRTVSTLLALCAGNPQVNSICMQMDNQLKLWLYETRSAWSLDQGSIRISSAGYTFVPTITKKALPHDTQFCNCRGKIVDNRRVFVWSLIHQSSWSR